MALQKIHFGLAEVAAKLQCTEDDLIQFAAYGQLELCILLPRNSVYPNLHSKDGTVGTGEGFSGAYCGPCALWPVQWRKFLSNREATTYSVRRIHTTHKPIIEWQSREGFFDWTIIPRSPREPVVRISECPIVVMKEEVDRIVSDMDRESSSELRATDRAHVSDDLAILNQAAQKWWANADQDDRTTHPKKQDVVSWLMDRGFSQITAESGATIINPTLAKPKRQK